jgi:uncharacterized lipoprotein YmbA
MRPRRGVVSLSLLAVMSLAGCVGGSAKTEYYTLSPEPGPAAGAAASGAANVRSVAVWQVAIPDIADRRQLVVRTSPNRVEISELHQWAEPLRLGIARALAADLAAQLGPGFAVGAGQPLGAPPELRVFVDVQKFEAVAGRGVAVEVSWSVRPQRGEARNGRSAAEEPAPADHAAIAAAYSRALARVAADVAGAVRNLAAAPGSN